MKKETITLKTFEELSKEDREKVLEEYRDINIYDYYWSEVKQWELKDELEENGFMEADIFYDLSYSQGSGACFEVKHIDIEKFLKKQKRWSAYKALHKLIDEEQISFNIYANSFGNHYCHEQTRFVEGETQVDLSEVQVEYYKRLEEELEEFRADFSGKIYKELKELYETLMSDEVVKETLIENEYHFYNNKIWN